MKIPPIADDATSEHKRQIDWQVVVCVWLSLLVFGAVAAPIPAVNEPHYLCKAKHFWQPHWCENDFFLTSSNAHTVFYFVFGFVLQWLSFLQTAILGRIIATFVVSVGWVTLSSQLLANRWSSLMCCWLYLFLASIGNFSGEWLIGGIEGKVICYGLLFASIGQLLQHRLMSSAAIAGAAVAIHPVVGIWGVMALLGSMATHIVMCRFFNMGRDKRASLNGFVSQANLRKVARVAAVFTLLALPGLIPVLTLLTEPVSADVKYAATYIQVYYRLAHHLDPMLFPPRAYIGYGLLFVAWFFFWEQFERTQPAKREVDGESNVPARASLQHRVATRSARSTFDGIVAFTLMFAAIGILIAWGERPPDRMPYFAARMHLLKFYPFRLADILLPVSVCISSIRWLELTTGQRSTASHILSTSSKPNRPSTGALLTTFAIYLFALVRALSVVESNRYSGELRDDWLNACQWIRENLPEDALVQAPHNGWAFKWFAERAEYVAFKDCPQDAAGIVEWNRRLLFLKKWYEDQYVDHFYSAEELRHLHRQTGITHLLTDRLGPLALEPIYRNATFQVYALESYSVSGAHDARMFESDQREGHSRFRAVARTGSRAVALLGDE